MKVPAQILGAAAACAVLATGANATPSEVGPEIPGLASMVDGLPISQAAGRDAFVHQVMHEAESQGVPPALADAVAVVETGYNPAAIGSSGEIGLMQIMPATAAMLGFRGTTQQLRDPATNIHLAVSYLGRAWAMSGGNVCRALMKYRAGWGEEVMTPLSVQYCSRAHSWLATIGSKLADGPGATLPMAPLAGDPFVIPMGPMRVLGHPAVVVPGAGAPDMVASINAAPKLDLHPTTGWHPPPVGYQYHRLIADRLNALESRIAAHQRHF